ncbi:MAG: aminoacyl-tRNA hydrolase [Deltaproteobacteria bacterium]|nr:aminoacyl-tRNA hydrolase [Deltaproteobacteria bacterium]
MKLIVGLGNPGEKYQHTRHNLGFFVVDRLAQQNQIVISRQHCDALIGEWSVNGEQVVLAKPQTFMNRSGTAVKGVLEKYHGTSEDLWVVYDDLDLPFGRIRIRTHGSAGGHRGIASILENLAGAPFGRIRVGIGRPPMGMDAAPFVLDSFSIEEKNRLGAILDRTAAAVGCLLQDGAQRAMEHYNRADG